MTTFTNTLDLLADVCLTVGGSEMLVDIMNSSDAQGTASVVANDGKFGNCTQYFDEASPLFVVDGTEYFRVESIVRHARRGKSTRFLVKWMGFSEEHNTWEPRKSLAHLEIFKTYKLIHRC
jgi:hypothetical protein